MGYSRFLLKRASQGVVVIWGIVTVVFTLRYITPGSPVTFIAPLDASQALREEIAMEYGLNRPIYVQYIEYVVGLLPPNIDMGKSFAAGTSVSSQVFAALPRSLELAVAATLVAVVLSIPLGVISATNRHEPTDYAATTFSLVGISTPNFWLGLILTLLLAVQFDIFPTGGMARVNGTPLLFADAVRLLLSGRPQVMLRWLSHITLPAVTLGTYFTALVTRLTRSGMLDELGKQYITALRAKGTPETLVRFRHALKNTLVPIVTVLGLQLGTLIGGAVITERVFAWPGLGSLLIDAINARQWVILQGCLVVVGTGFVIVNTVVDAIYAYLNPEVTL
ncbi:ABC transporter permease [Haloquadratum walsbyi]|uniref:ABC-type dipeptide/oligopeptide/nickel transport system, permease component n=1 Tax=Haloquadratum walsbyi J07HQW2 TaxID=1238425 RepID=U1PK89_9EURY|nr:ABC transporter permease [Haloquadratum walsbyi]ERG94097.1 MAG: ABC-type dipeptide/oligopeptide/nickel transport system, permease component [Haloquadratum walsbyi J07HQW2]